MLADIVLDAKEYAVRNKCLRKIYLEFKMGNSIKDSTPFFVIY